MIYKIDGSGVTFYKCCFECYYDSTCDYFVHYDSKCYYGRLSYTGGQLINLFNEVTLRLKNGL